MMFEQLCAIADALRIEPKASRVIIISGQENLAGLRRYLSRKEPGLVSAALKLWKAQSSMLSQAEIERMIMGTLAIPPSVIAAWEKTNEAFAARQVLPEIEAAAMFSAEDIEERLRRILRKAGTTTEAIKRWVRWSAGELITQLDKEIRASIAGVLRSGIIQTPMSPYQLSRLIRPLIGLTERWSKAVLNRYNALIGSGLDASKALAEAEKYAGFLHKVRALNIARTELADAYNEGQMEALRATGETIKKRWATDEDPCLKICAALDGEERDLNEAFSSGHQRPTAHPGCGCTLAYELVR